MSLDFGDLVLVIGDFHVPTRQKEIPDCFKDLLATDKIKTVLCTGNLGCRSMAEQLRSLGQDVHVVRGETDEKATVGDALPDSLVVEIGELKVGVISGYQIMPWDSEQALGQWQRKLDCDVLITGHTHQARWHTSPEGKLFLNPGSASGASNKMFPDAKTVPSFMLLAVQGGTVAVYLYKYTGEIEGEAQVEQYDYAKKKF